MTRWLIDRRWHFEIDSKGVPKVAREYHNRKMGITEGPTRSQYADEPNRHAFDEDIARHRTKRRL